MSETVAACRLVLSEAAFAAAVDGAVLAEARIAGLLAAKQAPGLLPRCQAAALAGAEIAFTPEPDARTLHIAATIRAGGAAEMQALAAATVAALALHDAIRHLDRNAVIEGVRLTGGGASAPRRSAARHDAPVAAARGARRQPSVLMGEVAAPRSGAPSSQRDAFRAFMTANRLRATEWAKDAGVPVGEILAFLTGRSRALSTTTADRLARAAKVQAEDMFR